MPKGKIEAFCMSIKETNIKLTACLDELSSLLIEAVRTSNPLTNEHMTSILGVVNAAAGLTRSNQAQLQAMLEEAYEKGV